MPEPEPSVTDRLGPDFDGLYRKDPDPWRVATSWYERRKLEVLLASLPRERYASGWEPACGPGITTSRLATRVDDLVASDASATAVELAERRLADAFPDRGRPNRPQVQQSALPASPLTAPVELVVVAESLYYLEDLAPALETIWGVAAPGAHLVFLHWRGAPHDTELSGPEVHKTVSRFAWQRCSTRLVSHVDTDFQLDVYEVSR